MPFHAGAPLLLRQIELLGWMAFGVGALLILAFGLGFLSPEEALPPMAVAAAGSFVAEEDRSAWDAYDGGRLREDIHRVQGAGLLVMAAAAAALVLFQGV